ncbi:AGE family epimerase/isomerase [Halococcus sp. IIIV-5B]|uniref:AGE family epimerase/isomerase n=1 Tax=Halococcus sp. IIIV-5B TaxID=2321230 RepID=UPI000E72EB1A|nr:AGE family epimerase/isomerase [Halococcus sp. IIIV-5B]RJT07888.1 AGE family epimerase/isomerase [Halococcus sp. IIIV-5B]
MSPKPLYQDVKWLTSQVENYLEFCHPKCIDTRNGGYSIQFDQETGDLYDPGSKHLVATCRYITNFSIGGILGGPEWCLSAAKHGLTFLLDEHREGEHGGFHWLLNGTDVVDDSQRCYGHAFALLALARAGNTGIDLASKRLDEVYDLVIDRFWEREHGLCRSEYVPDESSVIDYRGQNANMHMCEAMIAAYETTGRDRYLDRAMTIADGISRRLSVGTDGRIWEHYTPEWEHDFEYNRDDPTHQFRPWGYQPGHHLEWAKLLAILSRHHEAEWLTTRAEELFALAIDDGWDEDAGGFYYTVSPDGDPIVTDKYAWEVAEAIGTAALLYEQTGQGSYTAWYDEFWKYATDHLINPQLGIWYTKVTQENTPIPMKEGVSVGPSYHPIGACFESINVFH